MTQLSPEDALARQRYFTMALSRLAATVVVVIGIVIMGRAVAMPSRLAGLAVALVGLAGMVLIPRSMARRWRTPPRP